MFKQKEKTNKVLWFDDQFWGDPSMNVSDIPENAIGIEDAVTGDWTYVLERETYNGGKPNVAADWKYQGGKGWQNMAASGNGDTKYIYRDLQLPALADPKDDIHPSLLFRVTGQKELADLFKQKIPDMAAIQKGMLIAFVVSALVFTFLLVVVLVGD